MSKRAVIRYKGIITLRDEKGNICAYRRFFSIKQRKEILQQFHKLYRLDNKKYMIDILLDDVN